MAPETMQDCAFWPREGKVPENQQQNEKMKNANAKNRNKKKIFVEMLCDFLKTWRAQWLGVDCGIMKNSDKNVV